MMQIAKKEHCLSMNLVHKVRFFSDSDTQLAMVLTC